MAVIILNLCYNLGINNLKFEKEARVTSRLFSVSEFMISVDQNKCIGCGLCAGMCPDVFQMNADGKSEVIAQTDKPCAQNAAASCPVNAISA